MDGYIKSRRDLLDHWLWGELNPVQKALLTTMLHLFNHKAKSWVWNGKEFDLKKGQMITSLPKLAEKAGPGITIKATRNFLIKMDDLKIINSESSPTGRLITLIDPYFLSFLGGTKQTKDAKIGADSGADSGADPRGHEGQTQNQGELFDITDSSCFDKPVKGRPKTGTGADSGADSGAPTKKLKKLKEENILFIVGYLNKKTGANFRVETKETVKLISGRLTEGRTLDDFKVVIDSKCKEWLHDPEWSARLCPPTLFAQSNFEKYLQAAKRQEILQRTCQRCQRVFDYKMGREGECEECLHKPR